MSEYKILIEIQPESTKIDFIDKQFHAFNVGKIGEYEYKPLYLFLNDSEHKAVGGLEGFLGLGWFHISTLWIAEKLRGFGYGKALLLAAEQEAVEHCCYNSYVFTYSFQAPEFYQHLGYEVFGKLEDFPPGHCRYFLKKRLLLK